MTADESQHLSIEEMQAENNKLRDALWKLNEVSKRESEFMQKQLHDLQSKCEHVDELVKENQTLKKKTLDMNERMVELQQVSTYLPVSLATLLMTWHVDCRCK
jgi:predicted transcriptional regulator